MIDLWMTLVTVSTGDISYNGHCAQWRRQEG